MKNAAWMGAIRHMHFGFLFNVVQDQNAFPPYPPFNVVGAGRGTHRMEVDGQISEDAGQKRRLLDEPLMGQGVPQVAPFLRRGVEFQRWSGVSAFALLAPPTLRWGLGGIASQRRSCKGGRNFRPTQFCTSWGFSGSLKLRLRAGRQHVHCSACARAGMDGAIF